MWEEATREIVQMMTASPYPGFRGEFFQMPERNVIPKPLQKPHPPLWVAASRRETTMIAGRLGIGSLGFGFETPDELEERALEYYRLVREECMPIGRAINPALAVLNTFMIAETQEEAVRRSAGGPGFFAYSLGYYYNPFTGRRHKPGRENVHRRYLEANPEAAGRAGALHTGESSIRDSEPSEDIARALYRAARAMPSVGTVDQLRESLRSYERHHLDLLIFVAQCGDRKHEHIMESIERFGREILPEFKERHESEHRPWREKQLAGVQFPICSSI